MRLNVKVFASLKCVCDVLTKFIGLEGKC